MATEIYINTDLKDLTANAVANKNRPTQVVRLPQIVEGETLDVELSLVNSGGGYDSRSGDDDASLAVAVSAKGAAATSGTFTITASTETTGALAWNASAEAVQTALNALNGGTGAYGSKVDVKKLNSGSYRVIFNDAGARTDFGGTSIDLAPESEVTIATAVVGSASVRAQMIIEISQQPAIYTNTWSTHAKKFNGQLNANTARVQELIATGQDAFFEVKVDDDVVCQVPIAVLPAVAAPNSLPAHTLPSNLNEFANDPSTNGSFNAANWLTDLLSPHLKAVWGNITGTLSDQTDLQAALDTKAPIASPTLTGGVTISDATGSQFSGSGSGLVVGEGNTHTAKNSITVGKDNEGVGGGNAIVVGKDNHTSQENAVVLGSGNTLTSLDPPSAATDTVYDTFQYTGGGYLKHNDPEVSGQNWDGGWDGPAGESWRISGTGQSLFFNQGTGTGLATDGTAHIWCEDQVENYRNLDTAISASTTYCTMLVRPYDTAPYDPDTNPNPGTGGVERVKFRIQFYDGSDASGNMRLNAGIDQGTLFVSSTSSGYGVGDTRTGLFEDGKTYLLAMKRTSSSVYASLIEADGDPTSLDSEPTWQVIESGLTGVSFQSINLLGNNTDPNNDRGIRVDELRIADNWADAVAGLRYDESVKSIAIGSDNTIDATSDAIAIGKDNSLSGIRSYAMGEGLKDYGDDSTLLLGRFNENPADDSKIVIASGLSDSVRFTAMEFKARDNAFSNNSGIVMQALYRSASYLNDSQAAAGGVELGELYRAGNEVRIRMA